MRILSAVAIAAAVSVAGSASAGASDVKKPAAAKRAKKSQGVHVLSSMSDEDISKSLLQEQMRRERYVGITVKPSPKAGKDLRLQEKLAAALMKADLVPKERLERFRWIPEVYG